MAESAERRPTSLVLSSDEPLFGVLLEENGREVVRYFAEETESEWEAVSHPVRQALSLAGAWSDLDWNEAEVELDRIRHGSRPTPPIAEL